MLNIQITVEAATLEDAKIAITRAAQAIASGVSMGIDGDENCNFHFQVEGTECVDGLDEVAA